MDKYSFLKGLYQRKMIVLLVAIVLLFVVLFNSGMFGGRDSRVKITCVGDSLTYGSGVLKTREIDCYPSQLQEKLGTTYLVSNFGLRNATASENGDLPYIKSEQYKESLESNPDIVLLMLGTNDAKTYNWNPEDYEKGLKTLIQSYQKLDSKPVVYLMRSPYCFSTDDSKQFSIMFDVVNNQLGECAKQVAEDTGVEIIDLYSATEGKTKLYTDGVHFKAKGYDLISDVVEKIVKKEK